MTDDELRAIEARKRRVFEAAMESDAAYEEALHEFRAAVFDDVDALIDEVRRLRGRVAELEAELGLTFAAYQRGAEMFRQAHPEYIERMAYPDTAQMVTWLCERVAELEAESAWVPVTTRLPEMMDGNSEIVPVTAVFGERRWVTYARLRLGLGWEQYDTVPIYGEVVAWMPEPAPYNGPVETL
jgi:hypothetical protein